MTYSYTVSTRVWIHALDLPVPLLKPFFSHFSTGSRPSLTHAVVSKKLIFVSLQPYSTVLFGVPFSLPTPQGRWASRLRIMPKREIRILRKATHPRHGGHFCKPIQKGVPGLHRDPKAKPPRLTYSIFQRDCHKMLCLLQIKDSNIWGIYFTNSLHPLHSASGQRLSHLNSYGF
jgi:hypothetical protein